jgi:predicted dehydrogenase
MVRHRRSEPDFIWSTAVHAVDTLRHLAGEVEDYDVKILGRENLSTRWYVISLRFQNGTLGQIEVLPTAGIIEESYELFGEGFRAQVIAGSGSQRSLQLWRGGELELMANADSEPEDIRNGGYAEVVEFVKALKGGTRPGPSIQDVVPSMRICFSIFEQAGANSLG